MASVPQLALFLRKRRESSGKPLFSHKQPANLHELDCINGFSDGERKAWKFRLAGGKQSLLDDLDHEGRHKSVSVIAVLRPLQRVSAVKSGAIKPAEMVGHACFPAWHWTSGRAVVDGKSVALVNGH